MTATVTTSTKLSCLTPSHAVGLVPVSVSLNDVDYNSTSLTFEFVASASVGSFLPTAGVSSGGTLVNVTGTAFSTAVCRFGTALSVSQTVASSTQLICEAPPTAPSVVSLEVSNNNVDFTAYSQRFVFYGMRRSISYLPAL